MAIDVLVAAGYPPGPAGDEIWRSGAAGEGKSPMWTGR
jgi:hypothetical protein